MSLHTLRRGSICKRWTWEDGRGRQEGSRIGTWSGSNQITQASLSPEGPRLILFFYFSSTNEVVLESVLDAGDININ